MVASLHWRSLLMLAQGVACSAHPTEAGRRCTFARRAHQTRIRHDAANLSHPALHLKSLQVGPGLS